MYDGSFPLKYSLTDSSNNDLSEEDLSEEDSSEEDLSEMDLSLFFSTTNIMSCFCPFTPS
jgi:hypothetical protein